MNDGSDDEGMRAANRTEALTRRIVPALRAKGFQFVALDRIPQVHSAMLVTRTVHLFDPPDKPLRVGVGGKIERRSSIGASRKNSVSSGWKGVGSRLSAASGEFLSVAEGRGNEIRANSPGIGEREVFEVVELGGRWNAVADFVRRLHLG